MLLTCSSGWQRLQHHDALAKLQRSRCHVSILEALPATPHHGARCSTADSCLMLRQLLQHCRRLLRLVGIGRRQHGSPFQWIDRISGPPPACFSGTLRARPTLRCCVHVHLRAVPVASPSLSACLPEQLQALASWLPAHSYAAVLGGAQQKGTIFAYDAPWNSAVLLLGILAAHCARHPGLSPHPAPPRPARQQRCAVSSATTCGAWSPLLSPSWRPTTATPACSGWCCACNTSRQVGALVCVMGGGATWTGQPGAVREDCSDRLHVALPSALLVQHASCQLAGAEQHRRGPSASAPGLWSDVWPGWRRPLPHTPPPPP